MGGCNSGIWYRWNRKSTVEECEYLDITSICKEKGFSSCASNLASSQLRLQAKYEYDGRYYDYPISLDYTRPNYGGKRWWFRCPDCNKRVRKLYRRHDLFKCRPCCNLAYRSQQEAKPFRLLSQAQKIHRALGGDGCIGWREPPKPKGMHWKTYERKLAEMNHYHNAALGSMCMRLGIDSYSEEVLLKA